MKEQPQITQSQIWEVVTEDFLTSGKDRETKNRPLKLLKGEKIEIRFPFAWHFRTEDNIYLHAEPGMIIANCKLVGDIWPEIRSANLAKLEEILRLKLYKPFKED